MTSPPGTQLTASPQGYQIWSTVLGASLTSIFPDGTKSLTKIYAGGAVIANQGTSGISWTTADPVTGTAGTFFSTGGMATEETEPLGQTLRMTDPTNVDPPESYPTQPLIGMADDPQWQCEAGVKFWGSFSGLPFHCQMKIWERAEPFDRDDWDTPESNPQRTPARHSSNSADGLAHASPMPANLTPTDKPKSENASNTAVPAANVPDGGGDTIFGPANGESFVTVRAGGPSMPEDFLDASVGGTDSENIRNFRDAVKAVGDILDKDNGNNPCANLFGGRGKDALEEISKAVLAGGENSFQDLGEASVGIRMRSTVLYSPAETLNRLIIKNDEGNYGLSVGVITNPTVVINTRGAFVSAIALGNTTADKLPRYGNQIPGTLASRVVQLLHEIGHLIFVGTVPQPPVVHVNGKPMSYRKAVLLFKADSGNPDLSEKNTDKVIKACGKYINGLAK